jgi:exodeoxyribonuclease VII small subunit
MTAKPFEFEKALKELEEITAWFESSSVDLDAGLAKFERGMELASELKTHLASVENRVDKIRQRFSAEGQARTASQTQTPDLPPAESYDTTDQTGLFGA